MQTTGELTSFLPQKTQDSAILHMGTKGPLLTGSGPERKFMLLSQPSLLPGFQAVTWQRVNSRTQRRCFTHQDGLNLAQLKMMAVSSHLLKETSPEL